MEPHKTIVAIRLKTHKVNAVGEYVPPAVEDTKNLLFEIKGTSQEDIKNKCQEFLDKVKQWIQQTNQ